MKKLLQFLGGMTVAGLLFVALPASAAVVSGGAVPTIKANSGSFILPPISLTCTADNEVESSNVINVGLQVTGSGRAPFYFDEGTANSITVQKTYPSLAGSVIAPPKFLDNQWEFFTPEGCARNQKFTISGISVRMNNERFTGTAAAYVTLPNGVRYNAANFTVDTKVPVISGARLNPSSGTPSELIVTYSEPVYAANSAVTNDVIVYASNGTTTQTIALQGLLSTTTLSPGTAATELRFSLPSSTFISSASQWQVQARSGSGIKDVVGNSVSAEEVVTFSQTVVTQTQPTVVSVSPSADAVVAANSAISVSFSRAMDPATLSFSGSPQFAYTTQWVNSNTRVNIYPLGQSNAQTYQISVSARAASGELLQGTSGSLYQWNYRTSGTVTVSAPTVTSYFPSSGTVKSIGATVVVGFSKAMEPNTLSLSFSPSLSYGTVWSNNNTTLTITPYNESLGQAYTVNISGRSTLNELLSGNNGSIYSSSYYTASSDTTSEPTVSILIQNGSLETNTVEVSANVFLTNATQVEYGFKTDLSDSTGYIATTGSTTRSFRLPPNDGYATICARARNLSNGRVSAISCDTINVLQGTSGAPYNQYLLINSGNGLTSSRTVTLQLGAVNAAQMAISSSPDFNDTYWETYATSKQFTLPAGNGTKRVYVQFMSGDGRLSRVAQSSITLDGDVSFGTPSGTISINSGASTTQSIYVTLTLNATNANEYQIGSRADLSDAGSYQTYYATRTWTLRPQLGTQQVCVRFRNTTNVQTTNILCSSIELRALGTNYPQIAYVRINDGSSVATHRNAQLYFGTTGANRVAVSNSSDFSAATWDWFENIKYWQLSGGNGMKTVYFMFAAENGSVTDVRTISINLQDDGTQPLPLPNPQTPKGPTDVRALPSGVYAGMLVKREGIKYPAVYYIGRNGYRYAFPNQKVFLSWYSVTDLNATNKGGKVVSIAAETLASIQLGGNVTYRPGVRLVKFIDNPKVYALEKGGVLRWIASESLAIQIYGSLWNKMIDDMSDSFFVNYQLGPDITVAASHSPSAQQASSPDIGTERSLPY